MARLGAHGQELARVQQEQDLPDNSNVMWRRNTLVLMSDGVVLSKLDVRFRPGPYEDKPKAHSYGWRKYGRIVIKDQPLAIADVWVRTWVMKGYELVLK